MNLHSNHHTDKWQRMLAIVNQQADGLSLPLSPKKLFMRRCLAENTVIFLLQFIGLIYSTLTPFPMPLWFASGTAAAFIFMRGYSILPGIVLGSFFAYYCANSGFTLALTCAVIYGLQAFLLLWISHRYITLTLIFYTRTTFIKFILFSAVLTAITSLVLTILCYATLQTHTSAFHLWLQWWLANFNGLVIFACALISLDSYFLHSQQLNFLHWPKLIFTYSLLFTLTLILLFSHQPMLILFLACATALLVLVISMTYGWCASVTAVFFSGLLYGIAANLGQGIASVLPVFLCLETVIGLLLAIKRNPDFAALIRVIRE